MARKKAEIVEVVPPEENAIQMRTIRAELEIIEGGTGLLRPADVVEFARNPETTLHNHFTWNDEEAARQHRLNQARKIIRVCYEPLPANNVPHPVYISLYEDRYTGAGYRRFDTVMQVLDMRTIYMNEALRELQSWKRRFNHLEEFARIFDEIDKFGGKQEIVPVSKD